MVTLLKWSFVDVIGYLMTFGFLAVLGTSNRERDFILLMGLILPAWAAGPALFGSLTERSHRAERFLRTLPITWQEITTARFLTSLGQLFLCWCMMVVVVLNRGYAAPELAEALKIVLAAAALSLVVAGISRLYAHRFGPSIPVAIVINIAFCVLPLVVVAKRPDGARDAMDLAPVSTFLSTPWYVCVGVFLFTLWAFFGLLHIAWSMRPSYEAG